MKTLKILGIAILSILVVIYFAFLFILPNVINLNNYKSDINKLVKDMANLDLTVGNIKLKTTWNLQANIVLDNVSVKYLNKKEMFSAKTGEAGIKLLPLCILNVELAPIKIAEPKINLAIEKDGRYDIEKFANNLLTKLQVAQTEQTQTTKPLPIKISNNMPDILLTNYAISLTDEKTKDIMKIGGEEFKISDFKLGDKIIVSTNGDLTINGKKQVIYNAKIDSFLPNLVQNESSSNEAISIPQIDFNPIKIVKNYDLGANFDTNLKITQKDKNIYLKGFLNATELNYKLQGKKLDKSFMKLLFEGEKINIDSNLYVNENEKFVVNGFYKTGKKQSVNLHVESNKIALTSLKNVLIALLDMGNIKNDISQIKINGTLDSNFNIKSDFKKIESDGYLKVENASVAHSLLPLTINSIKSYLDFNDNKISIKDTSALVNGSLFNVSGNIDTDANADIRLNAEKLPLNLLYEAFAPKETKEALSITNGLLTLNAYLKGNLANIEPKVDLSLLGLKIREKTTKMVIGINEIAVDLIANIKGEYNGGVVVRTFALTLDEPKTNLILPSGEITFDTKDITIKPSTFYLDNSTATVSGIIKDYVSKLNATIDANGNFVAKDVLKYLPKEVHSYISAKGTLPFVAQITSDVKNTKINAQMLADSSNNLTVLDIDDLRGKYSLANVDLETDLNVLKINDIGLYGLNHPININSNFKEKLATANKIANITGKIGGLTSKVQTLQNLRVLTPTTISASIPNMKNSELSAKADIVVNGSIVAPAIKGLVNVAQIAIPDFMFTGKDIAIEFNKDTILAKSPQIDLNGSKLAFNTSVSTNFVPNTIINDLTISSDDFDVDKVLEILAVMPQGEVAPSASVPVVINKGHGTLKKVKSGTLVATNASGDFTLKDNLFKLKNLKATAYDGIVAGYVDYNIPYETVKANIQGRGMNANDAVTAVVGLKDQLVGKLDFDADISMMGMVYEQQMKTLKGAVNFSLGAGQMGSLGRLEHFIYASNLMSQKFAQSTLNSVIQTLAPKNTGKFEYLKGHLTFNNGWAKIDPIHSGGPQMSLYISGSYNLLNNYANIEVLGRVAKEIVNVMGSVGDMSVSKLLSNFSSFGSSASNILNSYNAIKDEKTLAKVPQLVPENPDTKQFQVVIDGNVEKPSSVRTFKWLASEQEVAKAKLEINSKLNTLPVGVTNILNSVKPVTTTGTNSNKSSSTTDLKEAAKNAATQTLKNALPSLWNSIE